MRYYNAEPIVEIGINTSTTFSNKLFNLLFLTNVILLSKSNIQYIFTINYLRKEEMKVCLYYILWCMYSGVIIFGLIFFVEIIFR